MNKEEMKRVIIILFMLLILYTIANIVNNMDISYRYLTYNDEWGYSDNCYLDNNQYAMCYVDNQIIQVKQFYKVK